MLLSVTGLLQNAIIKESVSLNSIEIEFLKTCLTKYPDVFSNIKDGVNEIIGTGKVGLHNIPQIILLISTIYKSKLIVDDVNIDIINIVQFTVDIIIQSDMIPLPDVEKDIIQGLIDASLQLLRTNMPIIEEKERKCFQWFKSLFTNCACCRCK